MKENHKTYELAVMGGTILPMDDEFSVIHDSLLLVNSGKIEYAGPAELAPEFEAKKTINAKGRYILPAFFNQHTHVSLALFRGLGTDMALHNWLQKAIWPLEQAYSNPENVYLGSLMSLIEMIKNGTGTLADMDFHSMAVGKAVNESGIRAFLGEGLFDEATPSAGSAEECFEYTADMISTYSDNNLINICLTPHAPFSCSPELYKKTGELSREWGIPVCSHLSETIEEVEISQKRYGKSPVQMLEGTGVFDSHFIAAHGVHLSEDDRSILTKYDVPIIHNPHSNMVLGSGLCPVTDLQARGLKIGIGTDSAASNNHLSMLRELQTAYLIHKGINHDPTLLPARQVLKMAGRTGYEIYKMDGLGVISEGFEADFLIIDLNSTHNLPIIDPFGSMASSAHCSDIKTLVVNGKIIMEDRKILTMDEEIILKEARKFGSRVKKDFPNLFSEREEAGNE